MTGIDLAKLAEEEKKRREEMKKKMGGKKPVKLEGSGKKIVKNDPELDKAKEKKKPPTAKPENKDTLKDAWESYKKAFPKEAADAEEGTPIKPVTSGSFLQLAKLNKERNKIKDSLKYGDWKEPDPDNVVKGWSQLKARKALEVRLKEIEAQILKFDEEDDDKEKE